LDSYRCGVGGGGGGGGDGGSGEKADTINHN